MIEKLDKINEWLVGNRKDYFFYKIVYFNKAYALYDSSKIIKKC